MSSRTSSNASLSRAHGYEDELESYLSLVAGGGKKKSQKKGQKRASAAIDWGRLLDSQQCEKTQKKVAKEEEVETEGDGNIKQFLKPKSIPEVRSEKTEKDAAAGPCNAPNQFSSTQKIIPRQIVPHTVDSDFTDSISMTDLSSDSEQGLDKMIQHKNLTSTATEQLKVDTRAPGAPCEAPGPQDQETVIERQQPSSALTRSLIMSRDYSSPTDDDTSSISQDLGLSSHFRNNIFTVDELEPLDSVLDKNSTIVDPPGADCTDSATSEDRLAASESSPQGNIVQLHNIVSLADLDSLPAESKTKLPDIVVKAPSDTVSQSVVEERGRENSKEQIDGLNLTSDGSEDMAYLTGEGKESVDTSKSDEYEEDFEEETLESAASPSGSSPDREVSAESETAGDSGSECGEDYSSLQTQSEQTTTCDSHSKHTVVSPSSNGAVAADEQISSTAPRSKAKEFAVLKEPIDSQQNQKGNGACVALSLCYDDFCRWTWCSIITSACSTSSHPPRVP